MREENVYGLAVGNYKEDLMAFVQILDLDFFKISKSLDSKIVLEKVDKSFIERISARIENYISLEDKIEKGFEVYIFLLEEYDKNIDLPYFYKEAFMLWKRKKADPKSAIISNERIFSQGEFLSSFEKI